MDWGSQIQFRNYVVYVGLVGLGLDIFLEVRLCMLVLGRGLDIPFGNYFGMMDMGCGLDILF